MSSGKSLAGFKLIRRKGRAVNVGNLPPEWGYRYKCVDNAERGNCQIRTTDFAQTSDYEYGNNRFKKDVTMGDIRYLDRHNVMCRDGESLSNFKVEKSSDGSRIRYKYTCCENPTNNCLVMNTSEFEHSRGDPHYLRGVNVQCPKKFSFNW